MTIWTTLNHLLIGMVNSKTKIQLPDLDNLQRVKLDQINNLPKTSGIYFVIPTDGQIYYM